MYADCPHCKTEFHISAKHISAADGKVRCGNCDHVFMVVERLHDESILQKIKLAGSTSVEAEINGPAVSRPEPRRPLTGSDSIESEIDEQDQDLEFDIPAEPDAHSTHSETVIEMETAPESRRHNSLQTTNTTQPGHRLDVNEPAFESEINADQRLEYSFTSALAEVQPQGSRLLAFFWFAGVVALLILTAAQVFWFNRDRVLQHYPEVVPYVQQFCARFRCTLIRKRDILAIQLVNRDVRLHPTFQETLLVNGTILNALSGIQPYPTVQINLFDTSGGVIGSRKFAPEHYLDQSVAIHTGMLPGKPIHFVLEITGQTHSAVSFEFRFL